MENQKSSFASRSPLWIGILSLIGAAISLWQTRLFFMTRSGMGEMHSFCNIGQTFDCTAIEMSPYAELAKGLPLSGFAIAGFLLISLLAFMSAKKELKVFAGIGLLFSVIYLGIMVAVIGKLCLLCLGVDAISLVIFILALKLPKDSSPGMGLSKLAGTGIGTLVVALLLMKASDPMAEVKQADLNDQIESVMTSAVNEVKVPDTAPFIGDPNAKVTIVKFSDYECPACKMGANAIHPLFKRYPTGVKFIFMNFPLAMECNPSAGLKRTMHEFACEAATVAVCATEQGKFPETYEALFENQTSFKTGEIADLVGKKVPGIDLNKLKECAALPSTIQKVKDDANVGIALKIQSTPTFFVNGRKVEGGLPTNLWIEIIDRLLKQ